MKRLIITMIALVAMVMPMAISAKPAKAEIKHVHPGFWWSGMKNPDVQVLIHGTAIGDYDVALEGAESVSIKEIVKPENKNYIILYLDTKGAKPQKFDIQLKDISKKKHKIVKTITYELKQRDGRKFKSFDSSDAVYLLMPDRFANGNTANDKVAGMKEQTLDPNGRITRHGGDVAGIEQHLDYLQDLGMTAIWTTPVFENDMPEASFHGYAITNYYETDPRYATLDEMRRFIDACHARGMKYILDIVFNHCGSGNFLYADLPAKDWFHHDSKFVPTSYKTCAVNDPYSTKSGFDDTVDGWFVSTMPDFNHKNRLVMDYLIQASIWWVEYMHIDGIRQDTYPYNDFDQMARWCQALDAEYPGFNIVGETWINNVVGCAWWQKDSKLSEKNSYLPSVMDFPLMYLLDSFADEESNDWDKGIARIFDYLSQDAVWADRNNVMMMLSNHDTNRFVATQDKQSKVYRYKQAITLLGTLRGIPQLYYGDEIGMVGNTGDGDWAVRRDFPGCQPGDKQNAFTAEGRTTLQREYFDFASNLFKWRKGSKAIAYGDMRHYAVKNGVYVYSRRYEGDVVTVVINGNDKDVVVEDFASKYSEVLPSEKAFEVVNKRYMPVTKDLKLASREVLILDFSK